MKGTRPGLSEKRGNIAQSEITSATVDQLLVPRTLTKYYKYHAGDGNSITANRVRFTATFEQLD